MFEEKVYKFFTLFFSGIKKGPKALSKMKVLITFEYLQYEVQDQPCRNPF